MITCKVDALESVLQDGLLLRDCCVDLKNDFQVCFYAVSQNGLALFFVSDFMKMDYSIICAAVDQDHNSYKFAHDIFKKYHKLVYYFVDGRKYWCFDSDTKLKKTRKKLYLRSIKEYENFLFNTTA